MDSTPKHDDLTYMPAAVGVCAGVVMGLILQLASAAFPFTTIFCMGPLGWLGARLWGQEHIVATIFFATVIHLALMGVLYEILRRRVNPLPAFCGVLAAFGGVGGISYLLWKFA